MTVRIINADVMDGLAQLDDESVHCVVTSPPYFGLRNYGVEGQIGLEASWPEHLIKLLDVFREVRRVMRSDATLWLNYGDAYAGSWGAQSRGETVGPASKLSGGQVHAAPKGTHTGSMKRTPGMKPKDLMMMPERLAIALCDDGWYVRSRIIWHKPNPMPESVTDRPTKSHEHIWLMSKSPRYFYDAEAIRGEDSGKPQGNVDGFAGYNKQRVANSPMSGGQNYSNWEVGSGRNARDVWTIATSPFPEAHFATFPPELAERCIKAGCPANGTVLDPFGGSGTTGLVADRLQRNAVLIELNPTYADMARKRLTNDAPLFAEVCA